ncbi:MAG TPA: glycerol-3-phosphate dehydrogenase [Gammaproteobacteria bacterium]|jgi:glycerol-3-phosphate dehydrogenase|nr:glycerol-3-phosphate dehydrogenase [Arenicellales bacterium]HCX88330.1 glycerol-3-phosphate dehydrogenase [Gammaproteobacteria bacterium]|tara:strand:- start:403 stop:1956 length:1554 start_codon:yes stop_codon:yes gene_type:complete
MFDVFIIGGGINGCGVARDAAGRGLSVCLAEKDDLGGKTSSGSTKLIHGGLRYLEHYEFNLVRKSLIEREVLWSIAPHIIYPLRFVLPHHGGLRPSALLRLGLFIYDHLGGRKNLSKSRKISLASDEVGQPLRSEFKIGFEYSDCWVDDARLVLVNARDAADRGAKIMARHEVVSARRENGLWVIDSRDHNSTKHEFRARILVNAAGPWVSQLTDSVIGGAVNRNMHLIRGSHIVVPKLYAHDRCYLLQNSDGRIVFVIPYEGDFSLIGTTDEEHHESLDEINIDKREAEYLCRSVNGYFKRSINVKDVAWSYSAVRPLFDDGNSDAKSITRDYRVVSEVNETGPPLISILGGKITTYRKLAEDVMAEVSRSLGALGPSWTGSSPLPGGSFACLEFENEVTRVREEYPFLSHSYAHRLMRLYGSLACQILRGAKSYEDLGQFFGGHLYENEVRYLMEYEWAMSVEDILWRRTKEGLRLSDDEVRQLSDFLKNVASENNSVVPHSEASSTTTVERSVA